MIKIYNKENLSYGYCHGYDNFNNGNIIYSEIPTEGLVLYIPLKENKTIAETGQNITTTGNISYREESGISCCYFDGSSYLQIENKNIPTGSSNFTISFWKKNITNSSEECDFIIGTSGINTCFGSWINGRFCQTCTAHGGSTLDNFSVPLEFGKFINVILTRNNNNFSVYINGQFKQSVTYTGSISSIPTFYIGRYITDMMYFKGYQSSYRIYNRVLTEKEIILLSKEFNV